MDEFFHWFDLLSLIYRCILVLMLVPVGCTLLGAIIFLFNDGSGRWDKEKPTIGDYLGGTMFVGFIGAILLFLIYGLTQLFQTALTRLGMKGWGVGFISFIFGLAIPLVGAIFLAEFTASQTEGPLPPKTDPPDSENPEI